MNYTRLVSTGAYLPETSVSNTELSKTVDTSHEWIFDRTGIESRHIASKAETTTMMGGRAAKEALDRANVLPTDVDMIVVATCTPDKFFPATACLIQQELGIPNCPAFDISAACSGFMYGLSVVDQFVRSGMAKRALLIGTEVMSRALDWQDRRTCVLFGDGAGAALFEASETPGILGTHISADGQHKDILSLDNVSGACIQMQGAAVFKQAVRRLGEIAGNMLTTHQLSVADLDWLVPHQANIRIIKATAERLGLPMEKVILRVATQGNTSAASIPLALDYGIQSGKIIRGQHLLLEAFGGGLTWGSALIRY
jgi:3-oxoacyl-[acyl-carrier-protein] synthase-3